MSDFRFASLGWWGYLCCAAIYVFAGLRSGDVLGTTGSAFFLVATLCFMVPHYRNRPKKNSG
jgi:hypothetical protein